ncbi:FAD-binding oxidoreductase [Dissulfurirhabdus thermomarina]|uniref:FAD-binding oxidoreductase n=1 Tax=Dissulfurirhabdus thermomarina TaxID=1765737 RepID=UPI002852E66E|nr:FAD-linked oxidase C-terminal domain-containing protein [Dissulfurirhabdus thermomarina]
MKAQAGPGSGPGRRHIGRALVRRLGEIVGPENVSIDPADLACYGADAGFVTGRPDGVVLPATTEETAAVLSLAADAGLPVVPRGAGTGTAGGAVPTRGGLVVALTRMHRIHEIDRRDLVGVVDPGVVTGDFQAAAEREGLFYPPDPASLAVCTLGGNAATGAGGARAVKYGVTRDYVLGCEVALPDGRVVQLGGRTAKGVVGLDLTRLLVGSEGTLGILTRLVLRLVPMPPAVATLAGVFRAPADAAAAVGAVFSAGLVPRCAEFLDRMSLACIGGDLPFPVPGDAGALVLLEVDGPPARVREEAAEAAGRFEAAGALRVFPAAEPGAAEALWAARRGLSPALKRLGRPHKVSEDVCVPRGRLADLVAAVEEIGGRHRVTVLVFGHAGDGNLHVNFLFDREDPGEAGRVEAAVADLMRRTLALGGTISGEHGVGAAKRPFIRWETGPDVLDLMRRVKSVFDPRGLMNPGKVFPDDADVG